MAQFPESLYLTGYKTIVKKAEDDQTNVDKFGGTPFMPVDSEWPMTEDDFPMRFWFQLTDPRDGRTVQLFMDMRCYDEYNGDEGEEVKYFEVRFIDYNASSKIIEVPEEPEIDSDRSIPKIKDVPIYYVERYEKVKELCYFDEEKYKDAFLGSPPDDLEDKYQEEREKELDEYCGEYCVKFGGFGNAAQDETEEGDYNYLQFEYSECLPYEWGRNLGIAHLDIFENGSMISWDC